MFYLPFPYFLLPDWIGVERVAVQMERLSSPPGGKGSLGKRTERFGSAQMIQEVLIEFLLGSQDFLGRLVELIVERIWPDGDDESVPEDWDVDALFKELEPKITGLIDSRIHGMEKRLNVKLDEIESSIKAEMTSMLQPPSAPRPEVTHPIATVQEVVRVDNIPRRSRPRRR
jgi:hypothetical protein